MNNIPTTMRAAFEVAASKQAPSKQSHAVKSAIRRKVGVTTRKTMWSVQRGNR